MGFLRKRGGGRYPPPPSDPAALENWMATLFAAEQYEPIWEHRISLGLGFSQDGMPQRTWFWLNAYPALAALRADIRWENPLGQPEYHPLVSTCAGWADEAGTGLDPGATAANQEIRARFFA